MSNNNDIITLTSADGTSTDFYELGGIRYKGSFFAVLQPVNLPAGMSANDVLVFRVTRAKDGTNDYSIETNDKIVDGVLKKFNNLVDKSNGEGTRAIGHPINMLLDAGVFVVLTILLALVSEFLPSGIGDFATVAIAAAFIANIGYFVVHLFCFLIGKR